MSQTLPKLYINSKRTEYIGVSILCVLVFVNEMYREKKTLYNASTSTLGVIVILVFSYSLYKVLFGSHRIIFQETGFKVKGYDWVGWNELVSVYPFDELDAENGTRCFLRFRLKDGTDLSIRMDNLEMSFEQMADLVEQYRFKFQKIHE